MMRYFWVSLESLGLINLWFHLEIVDVIFCNVFLTSKFVVKTTVKKRRRSSQCKERKNEVSEASRVDKLACNNSTYLIIGQSNVRPPWLMLLHIRVEQNSKGISID